MTWTGAELGFLPKPEPVYRVSAAFKPLPLLALPAPPAAITKAIVSAPSKPRVRARVDAGASSFAT